MRSDDLENDLHLLLAYADDGDPVLPDGLDRGAAARREEDEGVEGTSFYDPGAAGNDLAAQGWGVVVPEGDEGERLLAAVRPLLDARERQIGDAPVIYRVKPTMTPREVDAWRRDVYEQADPARQPYYQLFLGDLDRVPLALQQTQSIDSCVGRLAFDALEDYEAYVDKLLRWERAPAASGGDLLLHTVHDGTPATSIGARGLMEPIYAEAAAAAANGRLPLRELVRSGDPDSPDPAQLKAAIDGREAGVLFTLSHGEGAPRRDWSSELDKRAGQGAMSFGSNGRLRGDDVRGGAFLPGGVWFMFACYGAGTPDDSRFRHWLQQLRDAGKFRGKPEAVLKSLPKEGERPFVAALPRAALANPDGPVAFVGHLDLAWTYSFQELDRGRKDSTAGKFYKVVRSLLRGDRVGVSLREIVRHYVEKNQALTNNIDERRAKEVRGEAVADDSVEMAHLWMARQDLAGYVTLGDPAARLALSPAAPAQAPSPQAQRPIELRGAPADAAVEPAPPQPVAAAPTSSEAPAAAREVDPAEVDRMVEAVHAMIVGDLGLRALAEQYGVERSTLTRWLSVYSDAGREALRRLKADEG
ncbi:MAG: helix-turn-helix domain-containing protein [Nannocystaceae bacterium]